MSVKYGTPTEEQLTKINKLSKRTLSADEVFAFSGKSAGDMLIPDRYLNISKDLLQVMVDDAQKGVSFMYNHNWCSWQGLQGVPYGKVFDGELKASKEENEAVEMHLSRYIVRDDEQIEGMSANALIKKIETGVLSDTSISFNTDIMTCSICGKNYYSRECKHWRGVSYEMGDGTQKICTVTAMPPSIIIPYNNNALFEESIVWDGAYPGAMVSQAKDGDIIELPTGNFAVLEEKAALPDKTMLINKYCNGNILTMVKKSDYKKSFAVGGLITDLDIITESIQKEFNIKKPKGSEKMKEKLTKALEKLGIEYNEDEGLEVLLEKITEKWDATEPLKEGEGIEPSAEYLGIPLKEIKEKLGQEVEGEELLKFAKEGIEYHKQVVEDSIAMGVKAMANDFPTDTWKTTFSTMGTVAIKEIAKTWELQAKDGIKAGRLSEPKGDEENKVTFPDEAFAVGR